MTKTSPSRRISSAMASRSASRIVMVTISVPSGTSGSGSAAGCGGTATADCGSAGVRASSAGDPSGPDGAAVGADSAPFCCCAGCVGASAWKLLSAPASSPSPRMTAIGVLTATSAVPSGTRICPSVPSSVASTSMVALSVSISAMMSPDFTLSPWCFTHLARFPFSIVGDSAGINTGIGIGFLVLVLFVSAQSAGDVGPQLGGIGFRVVGGEFGRLVDNLADLGVDRLQDFLARPLGSQQPGAHLLDRVVLGTHLLDLLAGPVFGGVGHRVAAVAVGHHLEDIGAVALAGPFHRPLARRLDGAHVHAVDLLARNVERGAALGEIGLRAGAAHRGAHGVAVVLDNIHDRQFPQLRHVEAFIHLPLVGGAVAEIGEAHIVVLAVAVGEGKPGAERDLGRHDAVAAVESAGDAEHMHRAALALGIAVAPAGQFRHHAFRVHAAGQHMAVVAVAGDDLVAFLDRHLHADHHGFLADIEMAEAADQAHAVHLAGFFLEPPDQQHFAEGLELPLLAEIRDGAGRLGFGGFGGW